MAVYYYFGIFNRLLGILRAAGKIVRTVGEKH